MFNQRVNGGVRLEHYPYQYHHHVDDYRNDDERFFLGPFAGGLIGGFIGGALSPGFYGGYGYGGYPYYGPPYYGPPYYGGGYYKRPPFGGFW